MRRQWRGVCSCPGPAGTRRAAQKALRPGPRQASRLSELLEKRVGVIYRPKRRKNCSLKTYRDYPFAGTWRTSRAPDCGECRGAFPWVIPDHRVGEAKESSISFPAAQGRRKKGRGKQKKGKKPPSNKKIPNPKTQPKPANQHKKPQRICSGD